jgi:hypothetical protein
VNHAYLWQPAYVAALLETDKSRVSGRIYEAIAAIEQRLLVPIEPSSIEAVAIRNAQAMLEALRAELSRHVDAA